MCCVLAWPASVSQQIISLFLSNVCSVFAAFLVAVRVQPERTHDSEHAAVSNSKQATCLHSQCAVQQDWCLYSLQILVIAGSE